MHRLYQSHGIGGGVGEIATVWRGDGVGTRRRRGGGGGDPGTIHVHGWVTRCGGGSVVVGLVTAIVVVVVVHCNN